MARSGRAGIPATVVALASSHCSTIGRSRVVRAKIEVPGLQEARCECHIVQSGRRISAGIHAVFWFRSIVFPSEERVLSPATAWRGMPPGGRPHSCLRSTSSLSLDALGRRAQFRPLSRYRERRSRYNALSCRILTWGIYKATLLKNDRAGILSQPTTR